MREQTQTLLKEYQNLILGWARDKNITGAECIPMQRLKLIEEVGELADGIIKNNVEKQIDSVGDAFVVLTILAEQYGEEFDINIVEDGSYKNLDLADLVQSIIYHENYVDFEIFVELCKRLNLTLVECVQYAWNEIKDRKGRTQGGVFIKD